MIIDPENQNPNSGNGNPNPDEFVDSSFMVSFKANESASVSDKIKESENSSSSSLFDEFDEFENFDFDSSKSAFKPLDKPVTAEKSAPIEPPKASEKTDFEQVAPVNDPAFTDGNVDFKEFTGFQEDTSIDKKLFESGQDLDFASSPDSKSSFAGGIDDEFGLDEEALAINPFKPKNADKIPPAPSKPAAPKTEPAKPVAPAVPAHDSAAIKTYGKVSSGVDAFKKNDAKKSPFEQAEIKKPEAPKQTEGLKKPEPSIKAGPSIMKDAAAAPSIPPIPSQKTPESPFIAPENLEDAPETTPFVTVPAEPTAASPFTALEKAAPAEKKPTSNVAKVSRPVAAKNPTFQNRPQPEKKAPATNGLNPEDVHGSRPGTVPAPAEAPKPKTSAVKNDHGSNMTPVTQVKKTKSKSKADKKVKEPGKGGLFALIGVLAGLFVILWVLDNYQTWFGKTDDRTARQTQVTAVTTVVEPTEPAAAEETVQADATTEATTAATTTEAAETTETVPETEATTEATTTTTAEQTTTTTTSSSSNNSPVRCSYNITNPRVTSDGFVFDFAITNNGDNLNVSRLNEVTITFSTSSTITSLTSDYFTFTADGNNSFTGTPRSGSLPAGETTNITLTGVTENSVQHFYITNYHFDWD